MDKMDIKQAFKTGFKEGVEALRMMLEEEGRDGGIVSTLTINHVAYALLHPQGEDGKVMKWGKFEK